MTSSDCSCFLCLSYVYSMRLKVSEFLCTLMYVHVFIVPVRRTYRAWPEPDTERCLRPPHWCQPPKLANRFHDWPSVDTSTSTESALAHWHASHSTVSDLSVCSRPRSPVHEPSMLHFQHSRSAHETKRSLKAHPFLVPLLPSIALLAPYAEE